MSGVHSEYWSLPYFMRLYRGALGHVLKSPQNTTGTPPHFCCGFTCGELSSRLCLTLLLYIHGSIRVLPPPFTVFLEIRNGLKIKQGCWEESKVTPPFYTPEIDTRGWYSGTGCRNKHNGVIGKSRIP